MDPCSVIIGIVDLEMRHFRLVKAVAREGSMTRAANALNLTQPALSHQLAALEQQLQANLFQRTSRGMDLTDAGALLLQSAEVVLEELDRVSHRFEGTPLKPATLRLSTECYTCYHWLPSRIRRFQERFPNVDVRVVVEATRKPLEALLAHHIDVAIVTETRARKNIRIRKLFEDELVAIVSPQHRLAAKTRLQVGDFAGETLITYSVPVEQLRFVQEFLAPAGIVPKRICQVELTEAIVEMVKANLGIAVLARWAVAPHLSKGRSRSGSLKGLPVTSAGLRRQWYAATISSRIEVPHIKEFVALVAQDGLPFS
jgi:LysR family transcriptional regulator, regulator for metE and metH